MRRILWLVRLTMKIIYLQKLYSDPYYIHRYIIFLIPKVQTRVLKTCLTSTCYLHLVTWHLPYLCNLSMLCKPALFCRTCIPQSNPIPRIVIAQRQPDQHFGRLRRLRTTARALPQEEQHSGPVRTGVYSSKYICVHNPLQSGLYGRSLLAFLFRRKWKLDRSQLEPNCVLSSGHYNRLFNTAKNNITHNACRPSLSEPATPYESVAGGESLCGEGWSQVSASSRVPPWTELISSLLRQLPNAGAAGSA